MKPLPNLSIIAALSDNGVIGRDNALPGGCPRISRIFKRLTMGKPIVMGRRTQESFPGFYRIAPISFPATATTRSRGGFVVHSVREAIRFAGDADELMVVGGANLWPRRRFAPSRLYLTFIHGQFDGDTRFPTTSRRWCEVAHGSHDADARNLTLIPRQHEPRLASLPPDAAIRGSPPEFPVGPASFSQLVFALVHPLRGPSSPGHPRQPLHPLPVFTIARQPVFPGRNGDRLA